MAFTNYPEHSLLQHFTFDVSNLMIQFGIEYCFLSQGRVNF